MPRGMPVRALGPADSGRVRTGYMSVPFTISVNCVAGTSTYTIFSSDAPRGLRVLSGWGYMTGAGGAGDGPGAAHGRAPAGAGLPARRAQREQQVQADNEAAAATLKRTWPSLPKGRVLWVYPQLRHHPAFVELRRDAELLTERHDRRRRELGDDAHGDQVDRLGQEEP